MATQKSWQVMVASLNVVLFLIATILQTQILGAYTITAGDPVPGVDVSLEQIPGGIVAATKTDAKGEFTFNSVKPGKYILRIHPKSNVTEDPAGRSKNYNSSKSNTARSATQGMGWISLQGFPYKFTVSGKRITIGKASLSEQVSTIGEASNREEMQAKGTARQVKRIAAQVEVSFGIVEEGVKRIASGSSVPSDETVVIKGQVVSVK